MPYDCTVMKALFRFLFICVIPFALMSPALARASEQATLGFPDAVVLMGDPATSQLAVSRGGAELPLAPFGPYRSGHLTYPSLSRDGQLIATSYVRSLLPNYREGIAVYSVASKMWATYGEFDSVLAVSFSPDGSQLAVRVDSSPSKLVVLNLQTRASRVLDANYRGGQVSWSPDGTGIVYAVAVQSADNKRPQYEVYVLNLTSGNKTRVGEGSDPAWSPSGEWIAYLANSGGCVLVHPDGSAAQGSENGKKNKSVNGNFVFPPVWSPDSTQLLLNKDAGGGRVSVHLFDLGTGALQKKADHTIAALGWSGGK